MRGTFIFLLVCLECTAQVALLRRDIPVGDRPLSAVVGDFNGDSRPDLAVNSFLGLSVLLNRGGGSFSSPITTPGDIHPQFGPTPGNYTVAADFNRDGRTDLAGAVDAASPPLPPSRTIRLLLGRGDGTFVTRDVAQDTLALSGTGDFNGDRLPDLLVLENNEAVVQLGKGDGSFQRGARIEGVPFGARIADFNRDGFSDVAAVRGDRLAIWLNRRDGTFSTPVESADAGVGVTGDFNKDGVTDMVTRTEILLGKGDGTFQSVRYIPSRRGFPEPFAVADFDGDGHLDMAGWLSTEGDAANYVSLYRGRGDGTLFVPVDHVAGVQTVGQDAIDLDGDSRPDIITANFRSNTITLLMPKTAGPNINRAVSGASATALVAPESLATVYAATGATTTETAAAPYPSQLGGIRLDVRDNAGRTQAAGLLYVSPTQINFQVPPGTAVGEANLILTNARGSATIGGMQVAEKAPSIFMLSQGNAIPAATAVRVAADGRQTPVPVFNCFGPPGIVPSSCGPAVIRLSGDPIYLSLYGTGFLGANRNNVRVSIAGVPLPVEYAGPQGTPGVDQINVRLDLPRPMPPSFLTIEFDGVVANAAQLQLAP